MFDQDKINTFFQNYFWVILIPLIIYAFYAEADKKSEIKNNYASTYAKVYDVSETYRRVGKSSRLKREIKYQYYYKGKRYRGTESIPKEKRVTKGNYFMVGFSTLNPSKNIIYLDVEYKRFLKKDKDGKIDTIYKVFNSDKHEQFENTMNQLRDN